MYSYIKGMVIRRYTNLIILESNNIGYEIFVSTNTSSTVSQTEPVIIFTYLQVKEDGITLFGFKDEEEKGLFLKLISVSGIGGKTAIQILSGASVSSLITTIRNGDISILKKIKGIGKKTAERIILELREHMDNLDLILGYEEETDNEEDSSKALIDEATEVLISLGITKTEAKKLAKKCYAQGQTVEELVMTSLKNRG